MEISYHDSIVEIFCFNVEMFEPDLGYVVADGTMTWDLDACRNLLALGKIIEAYPEMEDKIKADMS